MKASKPVILPTSDDLELITREVWSSFVDSEDSDLAKGTDAIPSDRVTACVHVTGGYTGSVLLQLSAVAARLVAAALFQIEPADVGDDDLIDAAGEVVNIVGGNVKGILPGPSALSLPVVAVGEFSHLAVPGSRVVRDVSLVWRGEPVLVSLLHQSEGTQHAHLDR
jgi:chemotaxis protein CheX